MPAELVFVEQAPGISQSQRHSGKHRCQHPPAPHASRHGFAIKPLQLQFGQFQTRRGAAVNQQEILIRAPERSGENQNRAGQLSLSDGTAFVILKKMYAKAPMAAATSAASIPAAAMRRPMGAVAAGFQILADARSPVFLPARSRFPLKQAVEAPAQAPQ